MEESLNKKQKELSSRLYKPLIFYIPRKFWVEMDGEKWNDKEFDALFDTVVLMKTDGSNKALQNGSSNYYLLSKTAELDRNIYALLEMRSKLDEDSFQFLAKKYCLDVAFYKRVSAWMLDHIQEDIPDANKETLLSFELQKTAFENHWEYLQKHFVPSAEIKRNIPEVNLTAEDFEIIQDLVGNPLQSKSENKNSPKTTKKEKKILITEEAAEKFLLETVFNVKL
ncbi:hypothetical protein [Xanthomarina sp. F2636L]|uniref:hypothetical protein n=1 Tax=Xanthomarina sp. F2636L TaxID=2996018 RepID=UPI00225E1A26|nr:hypothetical protein [Xanthomarina sp. F2636L]MCX7551842.1 hypothetical protein [Xanthomarina sp. F2636L]